MRRPPIHRGVRPPCARNARLAARLLLALLVSLSSPAAAQRYATPVQDLSSGTLSSIVSSQEHLVHRCASRADTGAYLADVMVAVRPGARPSTLYNASIAVSVRSRHRDARFEGCVRDAVRDALRHAPYAVPRAVRAQRTFQIDERRPPRDPDPPPDYQETEVHQSLDRAGLASCLGVAGVPERVDLVVAVEADGRLTLMRADVPPGAASDALGCLSSRVSRLRLRARPGRRVRVSHAIHVRSHAH